MAWYNPFGWGASAEAEPMRDPAEPLAPDAPPAPRMPSQKLPEVGYGWVEYTVPSNGDDVRVLVRQTFPDGREYDGGTAIVSQRALAGRAKDRGGDIWGDDDLSTEIGFGKHEKPAIPSDPLPDPPKDA